MRLLAACFTLLCGLISVHFWGFLISTFSQVIALFVSLLSQVKFIEELLALSPADFEARYGYPLPAKSDALVTHCMKGGRAGKAADALKAAGYTDVKVYQGSYNDWKANDGPLESS